MLLVLVTAALVTSGRSENCDYDSLGYTFSVCAANRTRSAFFYWKELCNDSPPAPLWSLDCDLNCTAGTYLDLDIASSQSICSLCPRDTYNIGGGEVISGAEGDWTKKRSRFSAYCWTTDWLNWLEGKDCSAWSPDPFGHSIISGEPTTKNVWLATDLVYYANLVQNGSLSVHYSKVTRMLNGFHNGALTVFVNFKPVLIDDSLQRNHWQTFYTDLEAGPNEIVVSFEKYNANGHEDVSAKVDVFEVRGTSFSSHDCHPCSDGLSDPGSDRCEPCAPNSFLSVSASGERTCKPCAPDAYSLKGSVSVQACIPRNPCTVEDYTVRYSGCKVDTRNLTYVWHEPMICNTETGVSLPPAETGLPCDLCSPGEYHAALLPGSLETECAACPEGSALTEKKVSFVCEECFPGTYAPKIWNITRWTPLPESLTNFCSPRNGDECGSAHGWVSRGSYVTTGVQTDQNCQIVLVKTVNITERVAYVQFQISLENLQTEESRLLFEIDGVPYQIFTKNQNRTISNSIHLELGTRVLKWVYNRETIDSSPRDSASIHWISITGLSEGGSPMCSTCPVSQYSIGGTGACMSCPAGMTNNKSHQGCEKCPLGTYNDVPGSTRGCIYCVKNTQSTEDRTSCIGNSIITWENQSYAISNLTGLNGNAPGYASGICASNERVKLFCSGNFYGPLSGYKESSFYLSILNPGNFSLHKYSKLDNLAVGYAWGVLEKANLTTVHEKDLNVPDDACVADYSKTIVNLGSKVAWVVGEFNGFSVKYTNGSLCSKETLDQFSTEIVFSCDKLEGDGWPTLLKTEGCTAYFSWKTKYACQVCSLDTMIHVRSACSDGVRKVTAFETDMCYYAGTIASLTWEESCSSFWDLVKSWPGLIGILLLVTLLTAAAVLLVCFCKVQKKYQLLREEGDQGRGIELA